MNGVKLSFKDFYLGRRPWLSDEEVKLAVTASVNFNRSKDESLSAAKALLLRESANSRSWLVKTNRRLYRLSDNRLEETAKVNWSVPLTKVGGDNVKVVRFDAAREPIAVAFSFRPGKETRVDPRLFQPLGVERGLSEFIRA